MFSDHGNSHRELSDTCCVLGIVPAGPCLLFPVILRTNSHYFRTSELLIPLPKSHGEAMAEPRSKPRCGLQRPGPFPTSQPPQWRQNGRDSWWVSRVRTPLPHILPEQMPRWLVWHPRPLVRWQSIRTSSCPVCKKHKCVIFLCESKVTCWNINDQREIVNKNAAIVENLS